MLEGVATIVRARPSAATVRRCALELGLSDHDAELYLRGVAGGAGFTDTLELAVLNHVMGKGTFTPNAQTWIGLSSTTPTEAGGTFTEPSGGAYARPATQGTTATGAAWNTATATAPAYVDNSGVITFPTASADWVAGANLTYFGGFTALTAGTLHWFGLLTTPKPVLNGDTASFAAGGIRVQMGDPLDTY
jgi:hypothetical protein